MLKEREGTGCWCEEGGPEKEEGAWSKLKKPKVAGG